MTEHSGVFDPGFQLERTALAWRRTLLSLAVAFIAGSRVLLEQLGTVSYAIAGVGVIVVVVLATVVERRYRAAHRHLTQISRVSLPHDGALIAATAAVTVFGGVASLIFVASRLV